MPNPETITYEANTLTAAEMKMLRDEANWRPTTEEQVQIALNNSLYTLRARLNGQTVGMGRLVGDGALIMYIQDIIVLPACRRMCVGREIVSRLCQYADSLALPGTTYALGLFSAQGREPFYEHCGFTIRPNEHAGAGMFKVVSKP